MPESYRGFYYEHTQSGIALSSGMPVLHSFRCVFALSAAARRSFGQTRFVVFPHLRVQRLIPCLLRLVEDLLKKFRSNMKLQIMCFTKEPTLEDFTSD